MNTILTVVKYISGGMLLIIGVVVLGLTIKFYYDREAADQQWKQTQVQKIKNIDSVEKLEIVPLVEAEVSREKLESEPGVSYLIKADGRNILFDVGWNAKQQQLSPLLNNMDQLGVEINQLDNIFISHNHPDHTGGQGMKGSFALANAEIDLKGITAYTPVAMEHPTAAVELIKEPEKIAEGLVSLGPISRAVWLGGIVQEQTLAINVKKKGIVLVIGCGHPSLERIIERAEDLFEQPIYGVVGGLHYPVTNPLTVKTIGQKIMGPKLPWQSYKKDEVRTAVEVLAAKDVKLIAISPHDSCQWTIEQFKASFGANYKPVAVGQRIEF